MRVRVATRALLTPSRSHYTSMYIECSLVPRPSGVFQHLHVTLKNTRRPGYEATLNVYNMSVRERERERERDDQSFFFLPKELPGGKV